MATIAERMSRRLLTIEPASTLGDASRQMVERNVGSIVVLEGERVVGILTERDILRAFAADAGGSAPLRRRARATTSTVTRCTCSARDTARPR